MGHGHCAGCGSCSSRHDLDVVRRGGLGPAPENVPGVEGIDHPRADPRGPRSPPLSSGRRALPRPFFRRAAFCSRHRFVHTQHFYAGLLEQPQDPFAPRLRRGARRLADLVAARFGFVDRLRRLLWRCAALRRGEEGLAPEDAVIGTRKSLCTAVVILESPRNNSTEDLK